MQNRFLSSIQSAAVAILKALFLLLFCGAAALLIVYPLWKFGTSAPALYTRLVLAAAAAGILFFAAKKIRRMPPRQLVRTAAIILIAAAGIAAAVLAVLAGKRLLALAAALLAPFLCIAVAALVGKPGDGR